MSNTLTLWQRFESKPLGKWMFSRLVCHKAPYFGSIAPQFVALGPGRSEVTLAKRRAVLNHIGTVHAIAMCNLAELAGGTMTDVSIPRTHRWIPKGMRVEYLAKATTNLVAVATPAASWDDIDAGDHDVRVEVRDTRGELVFLA
ncbi:MAG: hotdog fold domain-containing protein, partial [Pseudomonadota bacterium]